MIVKINLKYNYEYDETLSYKNDNQLEKSGELSNMFLDLDIEMFCLLH